MSVLLCWAPDGRGNICGGRLRWRATATGYTSVCSKCSRESQAATGEVRELDALGAEVLDRLRRAKGEPHYAASQPGDDW